MTDMVHVHSLIEETIARYVSPHAAVMHVEAAPMAEHERGWSGAEIRRYKVTLQQGEPITLLTKTMPRKERRVMDLLSQEGHANVPFAYSPDLNTEGMVITCLQDLGSDRVGIPIAEDVSPPSPELNQQVARALAAIHAPHLGQEQKLDWLPRADTSYVKDFLIRDVWRGNWEDAFAKDAAFAAEFDRYTPALERAAEEFTRTIDALWHEGDSLTLTHGEVHGEHVMIYEGQPYFIDWGWSYYGPFYLDLPAYFTPQNVYLYRHALAEQGFEISEADFMERYHAIGRYVGFKYLCSGLWIWPPGPTSARGQRILMTIKWALEGTWPERAFAVPPVLWHRLLAEHNQLIAHSTIE